MLAETGQGRIRRGRVEKTLRGFEVDGWRRIEEAYIREVESSRGVQSA